MKFYAGVTDNSWFNYLSGINPEDINFWQPGGNTSFKVIQRGAPFLFKLKHPLNAIGGVGFFSSHSFLPLSVAWETFGVRNGCSSYAGIKRQNFRLQEEQRSRQSHYWMYHAYQPGIFQKRDWIAVPANWARQIV